MYSEHTLLSSCQRLTHLFKLCACTCEWLVNSFTDRIVHGFNLNFDGVCIHLQLFNIVFFFPYSLQMLLCDHLRCVLSSWARTLGFQNSLNEIKYRDSCVYTMQKWEDWEWGRDKWAILVTYHLKGFTQASLLTVAPRIKCKHLLFCINAHCFHILLFCIYILSVISLQERHWWFYFQIVCLLPLLTWSGYSSHFSCKNHFVFYQWITVGKIIIKKYISKYISWILHSYVIFLMKLNVLDVLMVRIHRSLGWSSVAWDATHALPTEGESQHSECAEGTEFGMRNPLLKNSSSSAVAGRAVHGVAK